MKRLLVVLSMALLAQPALAHTGDTHSHGFMAGLLHPVTGVDHLLMLLGAGALGVWAGRAKSVPVLIWAAMLVGAMFGHSMGSFDGMELVIVLSVAVAGVAMLVPRAQSWLVMSLPLLALAHGWAHGVEAPAGDFASFMAGFMISGAALMLAGHALGRLLQRHDIGRLAAGGGMVGAAALLLMA